MFTLGIINDEVSQDLEYVAELLESLGVHHIELRSMWDKSVVDLTPPEVERARKILAKHKLQVTSIASPVLKCKLHPEKKAVHGDVFHKDVSDYDQHLDLFDRAIRLAKAFETNLVRAFAFWREGELEPVLDEIIEKLEPFIKLAEQEGAIYGLENEHACAVGTAHEARQVLDRIPSEHLKIVWDPGNSVLLETERVFPDGYELIKDRMVHMHIKDPIKDPATGKWHFTLIGEGVVGYREHFAALVADGYEGNVSIETHYTPEGATREAGTRACIEATQRLMAEVAPEAKQEASE